MVYILTKTLMCAIIDARLKTGFGFEVFKKREATKCYEYQKILKIY